MCFAGVGRSSTCNEHQVICLKKGAGVNIESPLIEMLPTAFVCAPNENATPFFTPQIAGTASLREKWFSSDHLNS